MCLSFNQTASKYRRFYQPNATWFFTVNLAERKNNRLLVDNIDLLRECFRYVKQRKPYYVDAIVILPDHLHCIWTLPPNDNDYSVRWNMLKGGFSRAVEKGERISASRLNRRERGIWQSFRVLLTPLAYIHVGNADFGRIWLQTRKIIIVILITSIGIRLSMGW